jgi:hypothetical protein
MQPAGRVQPCAASFRRFVELGPRWMTLFSCGDSTSGKRITPCPSYVLRACTAAFVVFGRSGMLLSDCPMLWWEGMDA